MGQLLLFGLQWLAIAIPPLIIVTKIVAPLEPSPGHEVVYLQKTAFLAGITILFQILFGHRLPLIAGPSTVLLIGVLASHGFGLGPVNCAIVLGGVILALVGLTGFFGHVQRLFTPRVVATVLLLIAFTLTPTILRLLTTADSTSSPLANLLFASALSVLLLAGNRYLKGIWRSALIIWSMAGGTALYFLFFPAAVESFDSRLPLVSSFFSGLTTKFSFDLGVFVSFVVCFLGLSINDLGSIESIAELLKPQGIDKRINRGITLTGLANVLSGVLGIVGPVNFSLSPGIVLSTGCASRFALVPAAGLLSVLAFFPSLMRIIGSVPSVVIGTILLYILCFQVAAGLAVLFEAELFSLETGLVVGLPLLLANMTAFLPPEIVSTFPLVLRPVLGNGFVVGVVLLLILEHLVFRPPSRAGKNGTTVKSR
jgi:xanthine/uracil permease